MSERRERLLRDQVVLVSGGTTGLGAGIARAAARAGAVVAITGRRREPGEALAAELTAGGGTALFVPTDVADVAQARACVRTTISAFGRIDSLVNAAGLTSRGTLLDTTPELFDAHVAVNLRGPFFLMQAVVADLVARQVPGTIVNIGSTSAHAGQPYLAPYVAAKAGLTGLTRNAAHAHRWDTIRVNALNIGWTDTEGEDATQRRFHGAGDDWRARAAATLPMGKLGRVDEIADFVVFLLSHDAVRWVTGQEVTEVYAVGTNEGADWFGELGDVHTASALLTLDGGALAVVSNTRYNGRGHDVRLEVHGTQDSLAAGLGPGLPLRSAEPGVSFPDGPPFTFFMDRLAAAFRAELTAFTEVVAGRRPSPCTVPDAVETGWVAEACTLSRREHRPVRLEEVRIT